MHIRTIRVFALSPLVLLAGAAYAGGYPYPVAVERTRGVAIETPVAETAAEPIALRAAQPAQRAPFADDALATSVQQEDEPVLSTLALTDAVPPRFPASEAGGQAAAGAFEADSSVMLQVSDDVARLTYERDARRLGLDNGRVQTGFLLSEQRDVIFSGTLLLDTRPDLVPQVRLSAGTRAYAALLGVENRDVFALSLGVEGFYSLPVRVLPLELAAGFFYAPDVLAFGQADRIIDWNVDVGLRLREQLAAFAGFRFLQVDTRPGDREVDDEVHVGIRWTLDPADG